MPPVLNAQQRQSWEEDGWCVLDRILPDEALGPAQRAISKVFPSARQMTESQIGDEYDRWRTWDAVWPEFPFRSRSLNALVVSDLLISLAQDLLDTSEVRMYLAMATAKYANQASEYNQLLHTDFPNHTLTVPRAESGYHQMETFIYLNDVSKENGATRFVSRSLTRHISVEEHTLNLHDYGEIYDHPSDASAPAGSIVVYRPDVYHRSVDFTDPTQARFMLHVSYKPATVEWGGYQAWPIKGFSGEWHNFVQGASPRQLSVLGFPPPGHAYWTEETVAGVSKRYPGLDMSPWKLALAPKP
jgi:ectoine hydroxylase-related dioxygenase (phytanoyl-CoA dioxygenase family)